MKGAQSLQGKKLKELSEKKENVVLVEEHDIKFEPWSTKRVKKCIDMIIEITHDPELELNKEKIRKKCTEKLELVKFSNYHHAMFEKFTDPEYAHNEKFLNGIKMMINVREKVETGEIDEGEDADKVIVGQLLKKYHVQS